MSLLPSRLIPHFMRCSLAAAVCTIALAPTALAQKYQSTYGASGAGEFGLTLTKVPQGFLVGGWDGNDMMGVVTNPNGGRLLGAECPTAQAGITLTPNCVRRSAAGGVIVAGEVGGSTNGLEVFLAHYAPNGALWPTGVLPGRCLIYRGDGTGVRQGTRVVERAGGGYAVTTNIDPDTASQGVLFTTLANGWLNTWTSYAFVGPTPGQWVRFHDLRQAANDEFVIVGSLKDHYGLRRSLVLRTTNVGAVIWAFQFGGVGPSEDVEQHAITATANGNFVVWGHYGQASPTPGSFLFEVNGAGTGLWRREFPTILGSRPTIDRSLNGSLVMNGRVGADGLVLRTDATGGTPVARTYGAAGSIDELFQVLAMADGGYAAAGSTQILDTGVNDFYLVRADANGDSTCHWQPFPVAPSAASPQHMQVQLQETQGGQLHYLYMGPKQVALPENPLCFTPGPSVVIGDVIPTTASLPTVWAVRPPFLGDPTWGFDVAGLLPSGIGLVALSLALAPQPLPLLIFGGQPGSMLHGDPNVMDLFTVVGDGDGETFLQFPLPPSPQLIGVDITSQVFAVDPALPFPLPFGNSQAARVTIQ